MRAGRAHRPARDRGRRQRSVPRARHRAAREPGQRGAGERHRGARARLRRHVLRVARASERTARLCRAGGGRSRRGVRPRAARRVRGRLRARRTAGAGDEPAPLSARLALHVDARDDRRRCRGVASARAGREGRRARAGDRRVGSVWPQGELRDDGEAAARRAGGAERRPGGAAGAGRNDRERGGDRRRAGISRGDGQRAARPRRRRRRSRRALGDPRHRDHREAVSVVRRHAPGPRRAAGSEAPRTLLRRRRRGRSKSAWIRSCRRF